MSSFKPSVEAYHLVRSSAYNPVKFFGKLKSVIKSLLVLHQKVPAFKRAGTNLSSKAKSEMRQFVFLIILLEKRGSKF